MIGIQSVTDTLTPFGGGQEAANMLMARAFPGEPIQVVAVVPRWFGTRLRAGESLARRTLSDVLWELFNAHPKR